MDKQTKLKSEIQTLSLRIKHVAKIMKGTDDPRGLHKLCLRELVACNGMDRALAQLKSHVSKVS